MTKNREEILTKLASNLVKGLLSITNIYIEENGANEKNENQKIWSGNKVVTKDRADNYIKILTTARYAPKILVLYKLLQSLKQLGCGAFEDYAFNWTGFELKNLSDWLVWEDDPHAVYHYISGPCKLSCDFCYQKGNPPELANMRKKPMLPEVVTRLKYYNEEESKALFHTEFFNNDEVFTFPRAIEFLEKIREKSKKKIFINTNGKALSEDVLQRLSKLEPIALDFSITSMNPEIRKRVMNDMEPQLAINNLKLLKKYNIPFNITMVLWPSLPIEDIKNTILAVQQYDPVTVNLRLPGYSKYHPYGDFDWESWWNKLVTECEPLIYQTNIPILFWPAAYADNLMYNCELRPRVSVIKNSPAYQAGIRNGSIIKSINAIPVKYRMDLFPLLGILEGRAEKEIQITWEDEAGEKSSVLKYPVSSKDFVYPFCFKDREYPWGLILQMDISPITIKKIYKIIKEEAAKKVLVCTSRLMKPRVEKMISELNCAIDGANIEMVIPQNHYFGGSIILGDLLVCSDYVTFLEDYIKENKPDLILIPSTAFTDWGRDLVGKHFFEIERSIKVKVRLIPCASIIY